MLVLSNSFIIQVLVILVVLIILILDFFGIKNKHTYKIAIVSISLIISVSFFIESYDSVKSYEVVKETESIPENQAIKSQPMISQAEPSKPVETKIVEKKDNITNGVNVEKSKLELKKPLQKETQTQMQTPQENPEQTQMKEQLQPSYEESQNPIIENKSDDKDKIIKILNSISSILEKNKINSTNKDKLITLSEKVQSISKRQMNKEKDQTYLNNLAILNALMGKLQEAVYSQNNESIKIYLNEISIFKNSF